MQLARLIEGGATRDWQGEIRQIVHADQRLDDISSSSAKSRS